MTSFYIINVHCNFQSLINDILFSLRDCRTQSLGIDRGSMIIYWWFELTMCPGDSDPVVPAIGGCPSDSHRGACGPAALLMQVTGHGSVGEQRLDCSRSYWWSPWLTSFHQTGVFPFGQANRDKKYFYKVKFQTHRPLSWTFCLCEAKWTAGNENGSSPWHELQRLRQVLLFYIQLFLTVAISLAEKIDIKLLYYIKHNNKYV